MKHLWALFFKMLGYSSYFSGQMPGMFYSDLKNKRTTVAQKIWAWRNGFFSDKILEYGLSNDNKLNFFPDFKYYRLHPMNGKFSKWIDDKLTTKFILDGKEDSFMPEYYFVVSNKEFTPICEGKVMQLKGFECFLKLLKEKNELVVKKLAGTGGDDFYKIGFKHDVYYINNREESEESVDKLFSSLKMSIVTEYLHAHSALKEIYPHAPNALRVMVIKNEGKFNIVASFIRIGSSKTGVVDNATAGGIVGGIDLETGKIYAPKMHNNDKELVSLKHHPDTQADMEVTIPDWQSVKEMVLEASEKMAMLCYLGYDVVVTPVGPKIIEVNSHQAIKNIQKYYPLGRNPHMQGMIKSREANPA